MCAIGSTHYEIYEVLDIEVDNKGIPVWVELNIDGSIARASLDASWFNLEEALHIGVHKDRYYRGRASVAILSKGVYSIVDISPNPDYKEPEGGMRREDALSMFERDKRYVYRG